MIWNQDVFFVVFLISAIAQNAVIAERYIRDKEEWWIKLFNALIGLFLSFMLYLVLCRLLVK